MANIAHDWSVFETCYPDRIRCRIVEGYTALRISQDYGGAERSLVGSAASMVRNWRPALARPPRYPQSADWPLGYLRRLVVAPIAGATTGRKARLQSRHSDTDHHRLVPQMTSAAALVCEAAGRPQRGRAARIDRTLGRIHSERGTILWSA
ncbi:MAG: hypothetical protein OXC71_03540 [Chloroflexi bacterium]|nr:hypothetical protein [Chloroflexota bacterium]